MEGGPPRLTETTNFVSHTIIVRVDVGAVRFSVISHMATTCPLLRAPAKSLAALLLCRTDSFRVISRCT